MNITLTKDFGKRLLYELISGYRKQLEEFPYVFGTCSKTLNIYALNNKTYTRDNLSVLE